MSDRTDRRGLLASVGTGILLASAGCLGGPSSTSSSEDTSPRTDETTKNNSSGHHHEESGTSTEHHQDSGSALSGPSKSTTVAMVSTETGNHFEPHTVWVKKGGTVTWTLDSGSHSTTAYAKQNEKPQRIPPDANGWDSGTMSKKGTTFEHTFDVEGVFDYFCLPHESLGMVGSVIVGQPPPKPKTQPALQPPQNAVPSKAQTKLKELNRQVQKALQS